LPSPEACFRAAEAGLGFASCPRGAVDEAVEIRPSEPSKPLFERLGGVKGITLVVDDFIRPAGQQCHAEQNPEIDAGRKR
jgi:hypothetical protein